MAKKKEKEDEIDRIIKGKPPIYDEVYHITLLLELFKSGADIATFCSICSICRTSFYNWRNLYPAFERAYQIAIEHARSQHEKSALLGLMDTSFNNTLWSMIARNRYGYTEHRRLHIPGLKSDQNYTEQCQYVFKHLADGNLTAPEANQLANLIATAAKVDEITTMRKEMEEIKELLNRRGGA